jgi:hypothetical protein
MTRRAALQVEGLEDRMVLSTAAATAALTGPTLHATDEGPTEQITFVYGRFLAVHQSARIVAQPSAQITFSDTSSPSGHGQATQGAGAGKIKFNEFTIKKTTDKASPTFFNNACTGTHYPAVLLST